MPSPAKNEDLHGNVPDASSVVLLLIDVVNALDFEGCEPLLAPSRSAARNIAALKARAKAAGIPAIYVNDNFGKWRSDLRALVEHAGGEDKPGSPIVKLLRPDDDDYFVLKPKHSGFYATALDTLLVYLGAKVLVVTGLTGDRCVLFTASDAFLRDYLLIVPPDCTASLSEEENEHALAQMKRLLGAELTPSADIDFEALLRR